MRATARAREAAVPAWYAAHVLTRLRIENYRCLHDVTIDFEPLTVLVGANGSGKSAILSALSRDLAPTPAELWRREQESSVVRTVTVNGTTQRCQLLAS